MMLKITGKERCYINSSTEILLFCYPPLYSIASVYSFLLLYSTRILVLAEDCISVSPPAPQTPIPQKKHMTEDSQLEYPSHLVPSDWFRNKYVSSSTNQIIPFDCSKDVGREQLSFCWTS